MYETDQGEGYYKPFGGVTFDDQSAGADLTVTACGTCDDGPLFEINGVLTLAQLHELTHRLTMIIAPRVTARQCAEWAGGETLVQTAIGGEEEG